MKRSARFMALGIGIILAGILGRLFAMELGQGGLFRYVAGLMPLFAAIAGPIFLVIGFFVKDEK